jgi:hypothetical protein
MIVFRINTIHSHLNFKMRSIYSIFFDPGEIFTDPQAHFLQAILFIVTLEITINKIA